MLLAPASPRPLSCGLLSFAGSGKLKRCLDVFFHLLLVSLGPMALVFSYAMSYQDAWGWLNSPSWGMAGEDGELRDPIGWGEIQNPNFGLNYLGVTETDSIVRLLLYVGALLLLSLPRLITSYLGVAHGKSRILDIWCHAYSFLAMFCLLVIFTMISASVAWTALATCLNPEKVAPFGAACECHRIPTRALRRMTPLSWLCTDRHV